MKFKKSVLVSVSALLMFFSAGLANAGMYFEPSVGYNQGHFDSLKAKGVGFGFQAGWHWSGAFQTAADIGYHMLTLSSVPPASGTSYEATGIDMGMLLGWNFKAWKVSFTYYFNSSLEWTVGAAKTTNTGKALKFGIGGNIGKKTYLGLDVRFHDYEKRDVDGTTSDEKHFMDAGFISIAWIL